MSSYKFGNQNKNFEKKDKVYFIIFYDEKENAKKLGYKWDANKRGWYKELIYSKTLELHYEVNKNLNEPHIYKKYNEKRNELMYLQDKEPILDESIEIEESIPNKKEWDFACDYCKEEKLSSQEIQEIQKDYVFNKDGCSSCKTKYKLSKFI